MHRRSSLWALAASLVVLSCGGRSAPPGGGEPPDGPPRTPLVPEGHPLYGRLEAPDAKNACAVDADCVKGGCSAEVCAAENVVTTCEMPADGWPIQGSSCGCIQGLCKWYAPDGRVLQPNPGNTSTADPTALCATLRAQNGNCWPADGDARCVDCYTRCGAQCAILESCPIQFACPQ